MIGLAIAEVKDFMTKVLMQSTFDKFYLCDSSIETFTSFHLGGRLNRAFYSSDEQEELGGREYPLWQELKPLAFQIIKGKKLPVSFKLVFQLSDENLAWLIERHCPNIRREDVAGLYMNIKYENSAITCVTGTSFKTFIMDKTLEQVWDSTTQQFFKQNEIVVEML